MEEFLQMLCKTLERDCDASHFVPFSNQQECVEAMSSLPVNGINKYSVLSFQGNSTGCRMVHMYMARQNKKHCPHISYFSEEDENGNYKCDPRSFNGLYYNWTKEELDLFEDIALEKRLTHKSMARNVPSDLMDNCNNDVAVDAIKHNFEDFDSLDMLCHSYLHEYDATPENRFLYWVLLLSISVIYRLFGIFWLHHNAFPSVSRNLSGSKRHVEKAEEQVAYDSSTTMNSEGKTAEEGSFDGSGNNLDDHLSC